MGKASTHWFVRTFHSHPARIALVYMAVAALWIVSSSYLLPQTVSNPELQGIFEISKGLLFVLVTGILLYVILRNWTHENRPQKERTIFEFKLWNRIRFLPATFTLVLLLPALLLLIYQLNAPALEREGLVRLQSLANIQAIHIESWLSERKGDAEVLFHNRTLTEMVRNIQHKKSRESRDIVSEYLQQLLNNYSYESIILLGRNNKTLLTVGEHNEIPASTKALIREARQSGEVKHNHQFILSNNHLHTDYVIPLYPASSKANKLIAVLVMRAKLNDVLARTSQIHMGTAKQDSVLLMHIDKERLVAIDTTTGTPHHKRSPSQLHEQLPALIALRNKYSGSVITTDYRDIPVLAAWQFIAGTDWFILAKTDRSSVLAPLWNTLGWVLLVGTFLIIAIIALLHMLWSRHQYYLELEQLAREKQSDKLLKYFFDMPFVGMAIWSAKTGKWIRFNDSLCDMLGYPREQMLKLKWEKISHPDDLPAEKEKLRNILNGNTDSYTLEKRLKRIDGSIIYTNTDVQCVRDDTGKPEILIATIQDITAYRRTIEALSESESRFRNIFDGVLDGIVLADKETGALITGNIAFCNMLGYSAEELDDMSFRDLHPEDELPRIEKDFKAAANNPLSTTENAKVLRKDGSIFTADIRGGKVTVGENDYVLAVFRDTSERNAMIKTITENENRLTTLINTIPDLIWLKDANGVYLLCNATFERFFGARESEIVGKTDYDFVDKELADFFRKNDNRAMQAGKASINEETLTFADDGHQSVLETIKTPVKDSQGELIGILGIGRDITLRKNFENRIHRLSQFYAALSQCNEAIIRSKNEIELLQNICRIAVQVTQITATWVGFIDEEHTHPHWVAGYGVGNEEIASAIHNLSSTTDIDNCPCHQSIIRNEAIWVQNFPTESTPEQCHILAVAHGWRSAASLPLHRQGTVVGVLNLYADIENAFDEDVRQLLLEMSADISFALDNIAREEKRQKSEASLAESEQRFRGLVEQSLTGIYIIQNGKYVYTNPRFANILGFHSYDELIGKAPVDFIDPEDRDTVTRQIDALTSGNTTHLSYEVSAKRQDGKHINIGVHGALASHLGKPAIIGLVQDVTEKKQAEAQLSTYVSKLQASLMQTVEVATILSEMRDPYTAGHERRVAEIAAAIGKEMGLDEHTQEGLRIAGHLHDIGKINIPSEILAKPSKLTDLEYEIIKGHPQSGYNVLKDVDFPWPVAQVALQHHERINGTGYPQGLKGEEILLEARITAVADVVEAMGSHRPYRPGLGIEPALNEIEKGMGTLYDQQVAEACLRLFRDKGYSLPA